MKILGQILFIANSGVDLASYLTSLCFFSTVEHVFWITCLSILERCSYFRSLRYITSCLHERNGIIWGYIIIIIEIFYETPYNGIKNQ